MKRFASYGSLRKGFYNHNRFGLGEPIATSTVRGAMYVNPYLGYPMLYEKGDKDKVRDHVIEIYEVEDELYDRINMMEEMAGYIPKTMYPDPNNDKNGATVWFMNPARPPLLAHWVEKYEQNDTNRSK